MTQLRQLTAGILAIALTLFLFAGCANASEPDEADILVQNWEQYLQVHEQIHTAFQWAFSYAQDYARENDWDSLVKARAAASAALLALQQLEIPECTLTDEEYDALLAQGIEADVVLTEYEALPQTLQSKCDTLTLLNYHLIRDIFLTPDARMFADWVRSSIEIDNMDAQYLWMTTNYLLLQLERESLWDTWQEAFPGLGSDVTKWQKKPQQLMFSVDALLDDMGEELVLYSGYLGTSEYALEIVRSAASTGDLTELSRNMNRMEGVPGYFPVPEWLPDVIWLYLAEDAESGEKRLITVGDEISETPVACYLSFPGITLAQAESYTESLKLWALAPYETDKDGSYQMLVEQGSCQLFLKWTEEETVLYLTEPVGSLIPALYLAALNS